MTVVCAWCKRILVAGLPPVSHTICARCARDFEASA